MEDTAVRLAHRRSGNQQRPPRTPVSRLRLIPFARMRSPCTRLRCAAGSAPSSRGAGWSTGHARLAPEQSHPRLVGGPWRVAGRGAWRRVGRCLLSGRPPGDVDYAARYASSRPSSRAISRLGSVCSSRARFPGTAQDLCTPARREGEGAADRERLGARSRHGVRAKAR